MNFAKKAGMGGAGRLAGLLLILFCCLGSPCSAQGPELRPALRVLGLQEGLPSLTIYSMARDRYGRAWVGTQSGAAMFTGQRWESVVFPGEVPPSVIRAILEGKDGALWFASDNVGIWRLQAETWTHFGPEQGLPSNRVNTLWEGSLDGGPPQVVAGTVQGLVKLEGSTFKPFDPGPGPCSGSYVWKLKQTPDGVLWAAARGWIGCYTQAKWVVYGKDRGLPAPDANDLEFMPGANGGWDTLVSIWNKGVFRFDGSHWKSIFQGSAPASHYPTSLLRTPDPGGRQDILWVGTYDRGLAWLQKGRWQFLDQEKGLPSGGIYSLFPGGRPTVWLGTRNGGLVGLDLNGWSCLDKGLGLPSNEVTAILPTQDEAGRPELWVGTSMGLAHWQKGAWTRHMIDPKAPDFINSFLETQEGKKRVLWVGTLKGLVKREGNRWKRLAPEQSTKDPQVFKLRQGTAPHGEEVIWAGTQGGLASLRKGVWSVETKADGLPHEWIFDILETACPEGERDIWVGTRGGGVGRFHRGRWENPRKGLAEGGDLVVTCLQEVRAPDGSRWLFAGTQGLGLLRLSLDHPDEPWTVFTREQLPGLPEHGVTALAVDAKGRLFLSTPLCILRITIEPGGSLGETVVYTLADGLPSLSSTMGSLMLGPEGRMWVGTIKGLGMIDPGLEETDPPVPMPLVDRLDLEGRVRPWMEGLYLGHRENRLVLRLSLPINHHFEEVQFRTQILGLEAMPSNWGQEAHRDYPILPAGQHTLRIWARDHRQRESEPLDLHFQVEAPPWRRPWALILAGVAALLCLWGMVNLRLRMLTRRNRLLQKEIHRATSALESAKLELEDRVQERTQELASALERVQAADRAKSAFLDRMSHELRTPLNQMLLITQLVQEDWKEATGQPSSPDLEAILKSGKNLECLLSDLMDFSALEAGHVMLEHQTFDPASLLEEIQVLYAPLASAKGLRFEVTAAPGLPSSVTGDPKRLGQVIKDLVSNAIKFTEKGSVRLRILPNGEPGALRIEVDDTGPGIHPLYSKQVFEPFEQQDGGRTRRHGGTGLGLAISKRILALMKGTIGFEPLPTGGTRFWVEVALPVASETQP